jgi:hypothetical protein
MAKAIGFQCVKGVNVKRNIINLLKNNVTNFKELNDENSEEPDVDNDNATVYERLS